MDVKSINNKQGNLIMNIKLNTLAMLSMAVFITYGKTVHADERSIAMKSEVKAVELFWQKRKPEENFKRLLQLVPMVSEFAIDEGHLREVIGAKQNQGKWTPVVEDEPGIVMKMIPEYDEIRISNVSLADNPKGRDIGKGKAVSIATDYMRKLEENGLLNNLKYDLEKFQVGEHIIGEGTVDGKVKRQVTTEYRITFRPNIDNIELANAGVRLAVHRTGKLSGIRIGGVTANTENSKSLPRTVSDEQIKKRFERLVPNGLKVSLAWQKVMYAMPDGAREAVVEPATIYSYSLVGDSGDGQEVVSRRKTLGFSLTNADAEIIDYLPAVKKHTGAKLSRNAEGDIKRHQRTLKQHKH